MDSEGLGAIERIEAFLCPITHEILQDPVVASDGHTYSRVAIANWYERRQRSPRSPLTNAPLPTTDLLPNHTMRKAIEEIRAQQPLAIDPARVQMEDQVLGEGNHGRVVAGTLSLGGGRTVRAAVKMLPGMTQEQERQTFRRELQAHMFAARHCDGVCHLYGTCELSPLRIALVMKRYERSLRDMIAADGPLHAATVRRLARSLAKTLAQLAAAGIVCRDIKTENILLDQYDDPFLADFGISVVLHTATHIAPTTIQGTFNYMPPEAFSSDAQGGIGPHSDVWALACVIVEMLTGTMPWAGLQMQQIVMAVAVEFREPTVPEGAPAADFLRRCFAKEPRDRPTAAQLAEAFAPAADPAPLPVLAEHEQILQQSMEANEALHARVTFLNEQVSSVTQLLEQANVAVAAAEQAAEAKVQNALRETKEQVQKEREMMRQEREFFRRQLQEVDEWRRAEVGTLERRLSAAQDTAKADVADQVAKLERESAALRTELQEAREHGSKSLEQLQAQFKAQEASFKKLVHQRFEDENEHKVAQAGLIKVREEKEECIKRLQQDIKDKDERVATLTGELQSSQEEVAGLIKVREEKEECIKGLQQDIKDKDESVSTLTGELQSSQEEVAGLIKVREETEECIKGLQQDIKDKDESVSTLTGKLQSSQEEVAGLIKVWEEKEECIKGLQQDIKDKDEQNDSMESFDLDEVDATVGIRRHVVSQREKELEEQLITAREEVASVETKYSTLLAEKIADVDQFTKDRLHKTEELNSTLLKKAKEDSKLLEARELEIRIFEKRLLKNNQRIKILELLLTDERLKNDQLKASIDGGNLGGGGRTVKGAQRPIQGGSGRRAMHNPAQLQEGVVQDSKDSPVEAIHAFIKRIAGKE